MEIQQLMLKDDTSISHIRNKIEEFITMTVESVSSIQTVWEAFKATCRGWIISYASAKHRILLLRKI